MRTEVFENDAFIALMFSFGDPLDIDQVRAMSSHVEKAMKIEKPLRLLLDLSAVVNFNISAFASPRGAVTSLRSIGPVERYAVVAASDFVAELVELFGSILPLEAETFSSDESQTALDWIKN